MRYLSPITDPHRDWLDERNRLVAILNDDATTEDEVIEMLGRQATVIHKRLLNTPARTSDGLVAKMLLVLQINVEERDIPAEMIASVIREAQAILGMGSLAGVLDNARTAVREGR